ncbi:MFS transporter [Paraglaciecola hydrolytica]|uniref:MFS transporter n=1 Tax=Paraglaciecola hydrolytica TaxID=1799789 RepID=A0A148KMV7_9ALTE|nr:MFS transporter [Paraglaciecola hydrolytica]KXI27642.1 MFS transporter [Paraglaciecola hydrolytica]
MQANQQAPSSELTNRRTARRIWLRSTLRYSQKEALASSAMTATSDNFFNAFAIFIQASMSQLGLLTGVPQLFGAVMQFLSVGLGNYFCRKNIIVTGAVIQGVGLLAMSGLGLVRSEGAVWIFIALAMLHHGLLNLIQPHWRAWMGNIVPARRRGKFFASRSRITMLASLCVFLLGGALLTLSNYYELAWLGFSLLFLIAAVGRFCSAWLLWKMHDPQIHTPQKVISDTWQKLRVAWQDPVFKQYSLLVASMQSMVAISAPFFAVYMLNELKFTYLEFVLSGVASIATQFMTLKFWGVFSDKFGNRLVMVITCGMIPFVPLLWLFSGDFTYILIIQAVSGLWWSGFTLSTANYLYDIRPHQADFATYAAMQAGLSAALVFIGSIIGGFIASYALVFVQFTHLDSLLSSALFVVFFASSLGRFAVFTYFIPRLKEPHIRQRPKMLDLVLRVSRFNAISGVNFDWLTVTKKSKTSKKEQK